MQEDNVCCGNSMGGAAEMSTETSSVQSRPARRKHLLSPFWPNSFWPNMEAGEEVLLEGCFLVGLGRREVEGKVRNKFVNISEVIFEKCLNF